MMRSIYGLRVLLLYTAVVLFTISCTSMTKSKNSGYRWALIGGAVPVGMAIGAATAPDDEKPALHAAGWAGLLGLMAAVTGELFFDDSDEIADLRAEAEKLKQRPRMEIVEDGEGHYVDPSQGGTGKKVKWKVMKIDQWVNDGPSRRIHQNLLIEKKDAPE